MDILLAAATRAEIAPTLDWLQGAGMPEKAHVRVLYTGVGLMAATFSLTRALSARHYDLVIGAGIAGAFDRSLSLGECVLVVSEELGDLGAEDHDAFLDIFSLGFGSPDEAPFSNGRLVNGTANPTFSTVHLKNVTGLTVNTVAGNQGTITARSTRYGAQVESMEGAALHYVCLQMGRPFLQLRAISNYVTPRNRAAWKIGEAVMALNAQLIDWLKPLA